MVTMATAAATSLATRDIATDGAIATDAGDGDGDGGGRTV
jgi:hypothetical protein